jgi:tripartite-type tricarboxylate transporter receptor subunit TctC
MNKINTLLCSVALAASTAFSPAFAGEFPERPIELIVPFGAGGTTDIFARAFTRVIEKYLPNDQRTVVINKPGGASTIGMSAVANADPDGYTLGFLPTSVLEIQPHYGRTSWTIDDFEPVMSFLEIPAAINVLKSSPIKNYTGFVEFIKENPGKFTYTTAGGTGSATHLAMEQFALITGAKIRHIPFEGEAQSKSSVLSGQVMGNFSLPDLHKGGEIAPLIFLTDVKPEDPVYDKIQTSREVGIDIPVSYPLGIVAPKGTPEDRLKTINDAFKAAMKDPEIVKFFKTTSIPIVYKDAKTLGKGMKQRSETNKELFKKLGLI